MELFGYIIIALYFLCYFINNKVLHCIITPVFLSYCLYMATWFLINAPIYIYERIDYSLWKFILIVILLFILALCFSLIRNWILKAAIIVNRNHPNVAKISLIIALSLMICFCILSVFFNLSMPIIGWFLHIATTIFYIRFLITIIFISTE